MSFREAQVGPPPCCKLDGGRGCMKSWTRQGKSAHLIPFARIGIVVLLAGTIGGEAGAQLKQRGEPKDLTPPPEAGTETRQRKGAASFDVESMLERRAIDLGRAAAEKRNEAITELKKLIPTSPPSTKSEMIFRLAELYWGKAKYQFAREMEVFEAEHARWSKEGAQGQAPRRADYLRESNLVKENALRLYAKVLEDYPNYPRNDEVLFRLGQSEYEAEKEAKAVVHYKILIRRFPDSPLVPSAHLQLGEHYFRKNNVDRAAAAYRQAMVANVPQVSSYSQYKLAWCDYNTQAYRAGIKKLKAVISESESAEGKKALQLKSEALRDLARFFSHVEEVATAFAYYRNKGDDASTRRYMDQLGRLYAEQGKWSKGIETYRLLTSEFPESERAPYYQASIVEAYSRTSNRPAVRKEIETLVDTYRPGSDWFRIMESKGESGEAARDYALDLTESKLRDLVTEYHLEAQNKKDVPTYKLARDIYAKYLSVFPDSESAYEMRYFYAEVLWALDEWKNAAEEYRVVAEAQASSRLAREAAYSQILAWEKVARTGRERGRLQGKKRIEEVSRKGKSEARTTAGTRLEKLDKTSTYEPEPLPPLEKKLSEACDLYFAIAEPADPERPAIKYKAAYLYYKHNQFVEAAQRYAEIIQLWPRNPLAKKAANLILDSLNVKKEWGELKRYAASFRDNTKLVGEDKNFRAEVQRLLEGATYIEIQDTEREARALAVDAERERALGDVALRFEKFQRDYPRSSLADKAMFSAILIYNQADELDHAIAAAELLNRKYGVTRKRTRRRRKVSISPDEDLSERQELLRRNHLLRASFYEQIADFAQAAKLYDTYYSTYPKRDKSADALFNAGVYYQGLGQSKAALSKFQAYINDYDQGDEASVYWRVCELHASKKNWKGAVSCYAEFSERYPRAPSELLYTSRYQVALAFLQQKKATEAEREFRWLLGRYPVLSKEAQASDQVRRAAAHAEFALLEAEYKRYARMRVSLKKRTLLAKMRGAEELACVGDACRKPGKFLSVLKYGNGEYGICALTRMGQVYLSLAESIRSAPIPPQLTLDQQEIYRAELDTFVLGAEGKGVEAFRSALKKAYELSVYGGCTKTAQSSLAGVHPEQFPKLQKGRFQGAESFVTAGLRRFAAESEVQTP